VLAYRLSVNARAEGIGLVEFQDAPGIAAAYWCWRPMPEEEGAKFSLLGIFDIASQAEVPKHRRTEVCEGAHMTGS
jgi:hypothetical protein